MATPQYKWFVGIVSILYLFALFPFAFFRGDDWMMLRNAIEISENWRFAFSPYIIDSGTLTPWFFRPLFKFIYYPFYALFGLNYYPLLLTHLFCFLGIAEIGRRVVTLSSGERYGNLFGTLFVISFPIHIGSMVWAGEGLMNLPQAVFLSANTLYFTRWVLEPHRKHDEWIALGLYAASLLIKESAVFHTAFLFAFLFNLKKLEGSPLRSKVRALIPYAVLTAVYLAVRLGTMPLNSGYVSVPFSKLFFEDLALIEGAIFFAPVLLLLMMSLRERKSPFSFLSISPGLALYLPFLVISVWLYLGHYFFSPGWVLLPGYFTLMITCTKLRLPEMTQRLQLQGAALLLVLCIAPCAWHLRDLHWYQWKTAQTSAVSVIQSLEKEKLKQVEIQHCGKKDPSLARVLGTGALYPMWEILRNEPHPVMWVTSCRKPASVSKGKGRVIRWHFPIFSALPPQS